MGFQRVISAGDSAAFKPAEFPVFERRPVNYFRDQFADEEPGGATPETSKDTEEQIARAVAAEGERLAREHQAQALAKFAEGCEQGRREAAAELTRGLELLAQYAAILQAEKSEVAARAEQQSLDLAFALARKIVSEELATRPEAYQAVVRQALLQVVGCERVALRVHPDDWNYLNTIQADLESRFQGGAELSIRPDENVERGGCLIETEQGTLDAQIGSQLATLRSGLAESSESRS
ncbi:MAG: FliH/SctL family protein [bacterium]|nr:FliH/SctL family protein [bacterium]